MSLTRTHKQMCICSRERAIAYRTYTHACVCVISHGVLFAELLGASVARCTVDSTNMSIARKKNRRKKSKSTPLEMKSNCAEQKRKTQANNQTSQIKWTDTKEKNKNKMCKKSEVKHENLIPTNE